MKTFNVTMMKTVTAVVLVLPLVAGSARQVFGYGAGFEPPPTPQGTILTGPSITGTLTWTVTGTGPDIISFNGSCGNVTLSNWNVNADGTKQSDLTAFSQASGKEIEAFLEARCEGCDPFFFPGPPPPLNSCYAGFSGPQKIGALLVSAHTIDKAQGSSTWVGSVVLMAVTLSPSGK